MSSAHIHCDWCTKYGLLHTRDRGFSPKLFYRHKLFCNMAARVTYVCRGDPVCFVRKVTIKSKLR